MDSDIQEMLRTNEAQKAYYELADGTNESEVNGFATNLWRRWRGRALSVFDEDWMNDTLSEEHLTWLKTDLSALKVLDLGVGYGNPMSMMLAKNARRYVAIDLSSTLVDRFQKILKGAGAENAVACVADILSEDFEEQDFDLVYARAVFHHFKHFEAFLNKLSDRMSPGGVVITLDDPLETWLPIKLLRLAYRPFQTDADWEFPFTRSTLRAIERCFTVERVRGTFDSSKWAIPLGFVAPEYARLCAREWHRNDLGRDYSLKTVSSALRLSLLLRKK